MEIRKLVDRELGKIRKNIDTIESEINELPKGALVFIVRDGNAYYYLKRREGKKVISIYVGKEHEDNVLKLELQIEQRKKLEQKLKKLQEEERIASKMLLVR